MNDATRQRLMEYCPEIESFNNGVCGLLSWNERDALIMVALAKKIQKKGEWIEFKQFAHLCFIGTEPFQYEDFTSWLMNPPTFCDVAGEWVATKEG